MTIQTEKKKPPFVPITGENWQYGHASVDIKNVFALSPKKGLIIPHNHYYSESDSLSWHNSAISSPSHSPETLPGNSPEATLDIWNVYRKHDHNHEKKQPINK